MISKTPLTPLCFQASFTFYGGCKGYYSNHKAQQISNISVSWPNILNLRLPFSSGCSLWMLKIYLFYSTKLCPSLTDWPSHSILLQSIIICHTGFQVIAIKTGLKTTHFIYGWITLSGPGNQMLHLLNHNHFQLKLLYLRNDWDGRSEVGKANLQNLYAVNDDAARGLGQPEEGGDEAGLASPCPTHDTDLLFSSSLEVESFQNCRLGFRVT